MINWTPVREEFDIECSLSSTCGWHRISLQRASIRRTVTPNDPGIGGMSVHQGSDRPARYSTKAILAAVRALADACIDHATDLNFSLHAAEGATEEIVDGTVKPTMPRRQG